MIMNERKEERKKESREAKGETRIKESPNAAEEAMCGSQ